MFKQPPLQSLKIPTGWSVEFNTFYDLESNFKTHDDNSWNFSQDMLQITNQHRGVLLDLGWYPEHRASGQFKLVAIRIRSSAEGRE